MPLIARRGSISSRAYGQLRRAALPVTISYGGLIRFDNSNDITLFTFTRTERLAVSPFSTVSNIWKSATTNDLDTWSGEYTTRTIQPTTAFPWWGTGRYHVPFGLEYRPWVQTYYDSTANLVSNAGNVYTQYISTDGLVSWTQKPNNLLDFVDPKTANTLSTKQVATPMAFGDVIVRNFATVAQGSGPTQDVHGKLGPHIVYSVDSGTTYTSAFDARNRVAPLMVTRVNNSTGARYGNGNPYLSWSGNWNSYAVPPVGIWDTVRHPTIADKDYYVGTGGMLLENGGTASRTTYTLNQALRNTIGKYTWLHKVSVNGNRIAVAGWGCLPSNWNTGTQTNFVAVSTDAGATWTLSDSSLTTIFSQAWSTPFGTGVTYLYDDGTRWYVGGTGTNRILVTSTDGITWTSNSSANSAAAGAVPSGGMAVGGGVYLLSMNDYSVLRSTDSGVTWTKVSFGVGTGSGMSIVWTGTQFVTITAGGPSLTSTNGSTWVSTSSNWAAQSGVSFSSTFAKAHMITNSAGHVYAITHNQRVFRSTDGITWAQVGTLSTATESIGRCARLLTLYEFTSTDHTLYAMGDWATMLDAISVNSGTTWGAWAENSLMRSQEMYPVINGTPLGLNPVMTPLINGSLTITAGGSGYANANVVNVSFSNPDSVYGWSPQVSNVTVSGGAITAITLFDSGAGYNTPPTVTITDATGVGAGATATCSFVNSTANASVQMKRIMYWDYGNVGPIDPYSTGAGWYGTNPLVNPTNGGSTTSGNLIANACILRSSTDVTDATATTNVTVYSGITNGSFHGTLSAETDTPGILYTTGSGVSGTGFPSGDGGVRRIFQGSYVDVQRWRWSRPVFGYYDTDNIEMGNPIIFRPSYTPVYDANIPSSISGATPGIAWYVTGISAQVFFDSAGVKKYRYRPWMGTYAYKPATGDWELLNAGAVPNGPWVIEVATSASQSSITQTGTALAITSNGTDPSNKATTVIAWATQWQPTANFSATPIYPIAFITTNAGATWTEHTALTGWMSANGYLFISQLTWNNNEGKWFALMSKIAPNQTQTVPFDTVITADFITYVVKPNANTVDIPYTP